MLPVIEDNNIIPEHQFGLISYLSGRHFYVKHKAASSEFYSINAGVRQGSVLRPFLYTIFTSDMFTLEAVEVATLLMIPLLSLVANHIMTEFYGIQMQKNLNCRLPKTIDSRQEIFGNSDARERHRKLDLFRDMIGASVNLALRDKSCCMDINFLNRFLYARKFDCEAALDLLLNIYC
ncbi:unnamed protein product [Ceratitis capitata]|uniref:(Mediterranean fruit fly) hypothetical protein n=1 Tax=Ceratitis capitata TaxID=7213 RepID=A0A811UF62_CERCA|nr:unnamed protein product [Ceratitis capitata]